MARMLILAALLIGNVHAQTVILKCVDAKGQVNYTTSACEPGQSVKDVKSYAPVRDDPRAREELLPGARQVRAAVGPLEQLGAESVFEIAQPAAQGRLAYVQGFRRPSQAAVLGRDDRQTQITKLYVHIVHFIGRLSGALRVLPPHPPTEPPLDDTRSARLDLQLVTQAADRHSVRTG